MIGGEARRPPVHRGPAEGILGKVTHSLRRFVDLQVASVARDVAPWLRSRSGSVLEVGCGDQPYRYLLPGSCKYTCLDWKDAANAFAMTSVPDVIYYSGDAFPFADQSFDALFHTEVLEHVLDYRKFLCECQRVLKPGGEMFFTVPFQARFHFIPYDYWRFTKSGLLSILNEAGFDPLRVSSRGTDWVVAAYKDISVFYRLAYGGIAGKITFAAFSWLVVLLLCAAHACMFFELGSSDDCLGYSVVAGRPRV